MKNHRRRGLRGLGPFAVTALYSEGGMLLRPRLLVVESDESVRRVLARVLTRHFEVTPLQNGTTAVMRLTEERFDLALVDLDLPDMPGLDLLRALRRLHAALPLVVTSPRPDALVERAAGALGDVAYLAKPFDTPELLAAFTRRRRAS